MQHTPFKILLLFVNLANFLSIEIFAYKFRMWKRYFVFVSARDRIWCYFLLLFHFNFFFIFWNTRTVLPTHDFNSRCLKKNEFRSFILFSKPRFKCRNIDWNEIGNDLNSEITSCEHLFDLFAMLRGKLLKLWNK